MLKKFLLALAPLALMAATVFAEEDVLKDVANLKVSAISDAQISIDDPLASIDVDGLTEQVGTEKAGGEKADAIEACFRRFGYGGHGGYGGYGHYGYNQCYSPCYTYSYYCYQPYYVCYRPVVSYYTSYWGCW